MAALETIFVLYNKLVYIINHFQESCLCLLDIATFKTINQILFIEYYWFGISGTIVALLAVCILYYPLQDMWLPALRVAMGRNEKFGEDASLKRL